MANELRATLDAIDEAVTDSARASYLKAASLQARGMWDKGRAILEKYPDVKDGRGKNSHGEGGLLVITFDFVSNETGRAAKDVSIWVKLARKYPTKAAAQEWIDEKAGQQTEKYITNSPDNVHFQSNSNEWTTPQGILDLVEKAMGGIDLDPCSDSEKSVQAKEHFTQEDNGLEKDWGGNVYMNPPYGDEIKDWVAKLKDEYTSGRVKKAVALVPSRTDTDWFYAWRDFPKCFIRHRLKFGGHDNSAPFPSMLVYFGKDVGKFIDATKDIGDVYIRIEQ